MQLDKPGILSFIKAVAVCEAQAAARPDLAENLYAALAKDWAADCARTLPILHNDSFDDFSDANLVTPDEIAAAQVLPEPLFVQSSQSGVDSPDYAKSGPGKLPE